MHAAAKKGKENPRVSGVQGRPEQPLEGSWAKGMMMGVDMEDVGATLPK